MRIEQGACDETERRTDSRERTYLYARMGALGGGGEESSVGPWMLADPPLWSVPWCTVPVMAYHGGMLNG